jgi:hypothetical protein
LRQIRALLAQPGRPVLLAGDQRHPIVKRAVQLVRPRCDDRKACTLSRAGDRQLSRRPANIIRPRSAGAIAQQLPAVVYVAGRPDNPASDLPGRLEPGTLSAAQRRHIDGREPKPMITKAERRFLCRIKLGVPIGTLASA